MLDIDKTQEKELGEISLSFKVPNDFYRIYKLASEGTGKPMKSILIESFKLWVDKNENEFG